MNLKRCKSSSDQLVNFNQIALELCIAKIGSNFENPIRFPVNLDLARFELVSIGQNRKINLLHLPEVKRLADSYILTLNHSSANSRILGVDLSRCRVKVDVPRNETSYRGKGLLERVTLVTFQIRIELDAINAADQNFPVFWRVFYILKVKTMFAKVKKIKTGEHIFFVWIFFSIANLLTFVLMPFLQNGQYLVRNWVVVS
ncbi:hypothetical protein [Pedobacter jeongneungensis]|uniref:hypothetical protein n=1 Tax=Pedobacter jeongneungensis TaxID=947309 RepID=UPI000469B379|nr:hypothetical protein [Pedobacter jeongneungensis]